MAKALTAIAVKSLRPRAARYEVPDGGCRGLRVVVQPTGVRSYAVRYRFRGVSRKLTLGSVLIEDRRREQTTTAPVLGAPLTLADARWLAAEALRQVHSGVDPGKRGSASPAATTVKAVVDEYLRRHAHLRSLPRVRYDAGLVCESLGSRLISDVSRLDVVRLIDRVEEEHGAASADRAHAVWRAMANWHAARTDDYRPPTVRGRRAKTGGRSRVLTDDELRRIWNAALAWPFGPFVKFLLLTATRRDEARCMRRRELVDRTTWVIPANRCKTKRDILIPLSAQAQAILAAVPRIGDGDIVFTTTGHAPFSHLASHKRALDAASGVAGWRLHDLRRTARTLMSRAGITPDVAERCLGHAVGGIRSVYDRHEFEREKRAAFEALAELVGRIVHG